MSSLRTNEAREETLPERCSRLKDVNNDKHSPPPSRSRGADEHQDLLENRIAPVSSRTTKEDAQASTTVCRKASLPTIDSSHGNATSKVAEGPRGRRRIAAHRNRRWGGLGFVRSIGLRRIGLGLSCCMALQGAYSCGVRNSLSASIPARYSSSLNSTLGGLHRTLMAPIMMAHSFVWRWLFQAACVSHSSTRIEVPSSPTSSYKCELRHPRSSLTLRSSGKIV